MHGIHLFFVRYAFILFRVKEKDDNEKVNGLPNSLEWRVKEGRRNAWSIDKSVFVLRWRNQRVKKKTRESK